MERGIRRMYAKHYLMQVRKIDKVIQNKLIEKEQWLCIATSATASASDGDRVQSSGNQQKMSDAVIRMISIEEEINRYIDVLVDIKRDIIRTIEKLPVIEYDLLFKVYIGEKPKDGITEYLTLDEVAELNKKTYSWATTVHGRALKHVQDILDERESNGIFNDKNQQ